MNLHDQELARLAVDLLPHAALIVDGGGKVLARNAAATALPAGDDIQAVLRSPGGAVVDWAADTAALAEQAGGIVQRDAALIGAGDRRLLADVYLRRLGDRPEVLVLVEDVSARAAMERQLAASQRLAAAGQVTAKVAHELNNPLDGVLRYVGLAERLAGEEGRRYLAAARDGLMRMAATIHELLAGGARGELGGQRLAVEKLLAEAVTVFAPRAEAVGVSVECDLAGGVTAAVDGRMFQVFCNVVKNALDATPAGGTLTIRLTGGPRRCIVEFADTGCGMTPQQAERAFDPFYTTKPIGEGSGLGLAICREILSQLGGTISAAPGEDSGVVVTISVPASETAPASTSRS